MSQRATRRHFIVLVAALVFLALAVFLYKVFVLGFPLQFERNVELWDLEARVAFNASGGPVRVRLLIPQDTRRYLVLDENFISGGYGVNTADEGPNRQVTWSIRKASGRQVLYYRATVRRIVTRGAPRRVPAPGVVAPDLTGPELVAARLLAAEIRAHSADTETMVAELLKRLNSPSPDPNAQLLLGKQPNTGKRMRVAVQVLAIAGVPARVARGIQIGELARNVPVLFWLQVWDKGLWRSFDAASGQPRIPEDYVTWWRGASSLLKVTGGRNVDARISVSINKDAAMRGVMRRGANKPRLVEYSLFSLPIETQAVYHVLLMVPIGALILVLLRNVVGFKTFGTFMPILIALAFRETQLVWGVILFSTVVAIGLAVRFYLEHLKLLLVPRLASVLSVVVLIMAAISVISHKLGIHEGLSVALFPMVILTMTIERMTVVWEERGPAEALQQGLGSMAVAAIAYLVINVSYVQHFVFVYPELLLVVLAGTLLLGRYSGYRLTELRRFRALAGKP